MNNCLWRSDLKLILTLAYAGMAVGCLSAHSADQWPRFRGPDGSGISATTHLPIQWSHTNVAWRIALPGKGHSSPVVWNGHLFVTSGNPEKADRYLTCVNTLDGRVLWEKTHASKPFKQHTDNSFATSTAAVDESGVYFYWTTPEAISVTALTLDGKEKWTKNLGTFSSQHGSGTSLVIQNQVVWINNDQDGSSALIGLDVASGETKYNIKRTADKVSYATPCLFKPEGEPAELIFAASSHGLTSVNPANGLVNWECTNLFPARVVSSPVACDGLIVCTCGEGGVGRRLVAVRPGHGKEPAALVYDLKTGLSYVPTPLAIDGRLYLVGDNGLIRCVRAATGEAIWQHKLPEQFYASPVSAEGRLYLTSKSGVVFVLKAGESFELLAQNALGESIFATPAIAEGKLFFRTLSHLIAIGGTTSQVKP